MKGLFMLLPVLMASATGTAATAANPQVVLETSKGSIIIELYPEKAPKTVENFLAYIEAGFYDDTVFHRVIPRFMIQGGGFTADISQKTTREPIQNEADNGLKNDRGTLAMARTGDPHSATAQFFINNVDNDFLNHTSKDSRGWGYAVFARVIEGLNVVDEISGVRTATRAGMENVPVETVTINSASVRQSE